MRTVAQLGDGTRTRSSLHKMQARSPLHHRLPIPRLRTAVPAQAGRACGRLAGPRGADSLPGGCCLFNRALSGSNADPG